MKRDRGGRAEIPDAPPTTFRPLDPGLEQTLADIDQVLADHDRLAAEVTA